MSLAVASRYARALLDVLSGPDAGVSGDDALAGLTAFHALQESSAELRNVLQSPAVAPNRKRAAVSRLADRLGLARVVRNFLFVLIGHRRTALLKDVLEALRAQMDERVGIARASIASARPLDEPSRGDVEAALSRATGKKVVGQYAVDGSLIGGVLARVGSRVYDGSVRGQLQAMRGRLVRS